MKILENIDLRLHSTMRLGGRARYLAEAASEDDIQQLLDWARQRKLPLMVIGHGSNIVWRDEGFEGLIIVNKIIGLEITLQEDDVFLIRAGAGEKWDDLVAASVAQGLTGIEFLSAIPGTAGGAPVQNIGAYGAELASTLVEVEAFDTQTNAFGGILNEACGFSYRNSRFKSSDRERFIITGIVLQLKKGSPTPPFYESLQNYLTQQQKLEAPQSDYRLLRSGFAAGQASLSKEYTPQEIREAVIAIRKIRLPDPSVVANNGSFFTNPIIEKVQFEDLQKKYPDIKGWPYEDKVKISAGWLVESAGFKEVHDAATGMATWQGNALVMVNEHAQRTADLLAFKQKITDKVQEMFGVPLQQEPELLP